MIRSVLHGISALAWPLVAAWFALTERGSRSEITALRAAYRACIDQNQGLLICARHHRASDGWRLLWLLAPPFAYLLHPRQRPWFVADPHSRFATRFAWFWHRLGKVIAVRQGTGAWTHAATKERLLQCLRQGQSIAIFPAGDDSEEEPYSVLLGQVWAAAPMTRVLCVRLDPTAPHFRVVALPRIASGWRGVRACALHIRTELRELDGREEPCSVST